MAVVVAAEEVAAAEEPNMDPPVPKMEGLAEPPNPLPAPNGEGSGAAVAAFAVDAAVAGAAPFASAFAAGAGTVAAKAEEEGAKGAGVWPNTRGAIADIGG